MVSAGRPLRIHRFTGVPVSAGIGKGTRTGRPIGITAGAARLEHARWFPPWEHQGPQTSAIRPRPPAGVGGGAAAQAARTTRRAADGARPGTLARLSAAGRVVAADRADTSRPLGAAAACPCAVTLIYPERVEHPGADFSLQREPRGRRIPRRAAPAGGPGGPSADGTGGRGRSRAESEARGRRAGSARPCRCGHRDRRVQRRLARGRRGRGRPAGRSRTAGTARGLPDGAPRRPPSPPAPARTAVPLACPGRDGRPRRRTPGRTSPCSRSPAAASPGTRRSAGSRSPATRCAPASASPTGAPPNCRQLRADDGRPAGG
jgi:hypothetical protein